MVRTLLLDCATELETRLRAQGFDVESGTVGFCTGVRKLPAQLYEKDVIIYNPLAVSQGATTSKELIEDKTPEFELKYLESRIRNGATLLVFVNRLSDSIESQRALYSWIPHMPGIRFTSDKAVGGSRFQDYPESSWRVLAPVVAPESLAFPVLQKLDSPEARDYPRDVFPLFWNGHGDDLGVLIMRGDGRLIVLPKFRSNEDVIETFLHRVVPRMYPGTARTGLVEAFVSLDELAEQDQLRELELQEKYVKDRESAARSRLASAIRQKSISIEADGTAKQILVYWTTPDARMMLRFTISIRLSNPSRTN
jgi:hypothetical protein